MPTYEYRCTKGHQFEVEQRITAEPLKRCQLCRSKVQRLISPSTFILKGSGWYSDGYGSAASKGGSSDSSSSSSSKDGKSGSSSDSEGSSDSKGSGDSKGSKSKSSKASAGGSSGD